MNKLFILLASFILSRAFMMLVSSYTEGAFASLVGCILYIILFLLFSPHTRADKKQIGLGKSVLTVVFFVLISFALSSALDIFFEIENQDIPLLQGVIAILIVPFAEELFFRATLFKTFDFLVSPTLACLMSSFLFSLAHTGLPSVIASFVLGIMLTLIYKKTGSIKLPVICHMANNLLAFVLLKGL